ncbi:MAG: aminoglycoside phosphotransferase, partial [Mesorhizobium sp.]
MTDFEALTHDQQLGILQETAEAAIANYDLPADVSVTMINLSENATYKVEPGIGEALAEPFEVLGEVTARMHIHARQWKRPSWFTRHVWDFETSLGEENPHWGRWRDGMGVDAAKAKLFGRSAELICRRLAAFG